MSNMRCTVLHKFNDLDVGVDVGCGEAKKVVRFSWFFPLHRIILVSRLTFMYSTYTAQ